MRQKKQIFISIIALFTFQYLFTQDNDYYINKYGDFFKNDFILNPAYIGATDRQNINISYHSDWIGSKNNPFKTNISYDFLIGKKKFLGFGFYYEYSSDNIVKNNTANLSFNLNFKIGNKMRIKWGNSVFNYNWNDFSKVNTLTVVRLFDPWPDYYNDVNKDYINFTSGLWFDYKNIYTSISLNNIKQYFNEFKEQSYPSYLSGYTIKLPWELYINSGLDLKITEKWMLQPNFEIIKIKYERLEFSPTVFLNYNKKYVLGLSYIYLRILSINFASQLFNNFELGSSIGVPMNNMLNISSISHLDCKLKYSF